jgi:hypothetical protein
VAEKGMRAVVIVRLNAGHEKLCLKIRQNMMKKTANVFADREIKRYTEKIAAM